LGANAQPARRQRRGHAIRPPGAPALAFASQFARPELASEGTGLPQCPGLNAFVRTATRPVTTRAAQGGDQSFLAPGTLRGRLS
jgi:hypothetical protein